MGEACTLYRSILATVRKILTAKVGLIITLEKKIYSDLFRLIVWISRDRLLAFINVPQLKLIEREYLTTQKINNSKRRLRR